MTEIWYDQCDDNENESDVAINPKTHLLLKVYIMFLFTWQSLFRVLDAGINVLLLFVVKLLHLLVSGFGVNNMNYFMDLFPRNVVAARKFIGQTSDTFSKYVSCPACHSIYTLDSCKIELPDKSVCSRKCSYIRFPNHPHLSKRLPCNVQLIKTVRTSAGTTSLYPRQLYCYHSIIDHLKDRVKSPGFFEKCEMWRSRNKEEGVLMDIYDGMIFRILMENPFSHFLITLLSH